MTTGATSASKGSVECMHLGPMKRDEILRSSFHPTCRVSDGTAEAEDIWGRHREQQLQGQLLQHRGESMSQFSYCFALRFREKKTHVKKNETCCVCSVIFFQVFLTRCPATNATSCNCCIVGHCCRMQLDLHFAGNGYKALQSDTEIGKLESIASDGQFELLNLRYKFCKSTLTKP